MKGLKVMTGLALVSATPCFGQTDPLCDQMMNGPVLHTPGTATCLYDAASRTAVISMNDETILEWQTMRQTEGDRVEFLFDAGVSNPSVLNRLRSPFAHEIGGEIFSNGRVVFLSPGAALQVSATVDASEFVAISHVATGSGETALLQRQPVNFVASAPGLSQVNVRGARITASNGDVVLGSSRAVTINNTGGGSEISATGSTRIFAGSNISYNPDAARALVPAAGTSNGSITNLARLDGSDVELVAGSSITNDGVVAATGTQAGPGRFYLQVENGTIVNRPGGLLTGIIVANRQVDNQGVLLNPQEGDSVAATAPRTEIFPALRESTDRHSKRTKEVEVVRAAPAVASASANPVQGTRTGTARKQDTRPVLVSRSAFFGMRGKGKKEGE